MSSASTRFHALELYVEFVARRHNRDLRSKQISCSFISRKAAQDTEIKGLKIPAGMSILFPSKVMHSDEKLWENPTVFNPDRFLEKTYNPMAYQVCTESWVVSGEAQQLDYYLII